MLYSHWLCAHLAVWLVQAKAAVTAAALVREMTTLGLGAVPLSCELTSDATHTSSCC